MSINDPVLVILDERHGGYIAVQGRETFYDEQRLLRTWDTSEEACAWVQEALGREPVCRDVQGLLLRS